MAFVASELSKFVLVIATVSTDISAYITDTTGLPGKRDLADVTAFGSVGRRWKPSLENSEFTLNVLYSEDATYGTNTTVGLLRTTSTVCPFKFYPNGTAAQCISGNCWVDDFSTISKVGDAVKATIHFKSDNGITIS